MRQFDIQKLDQLVAEGKLMVQIHPKFPLRIYKYTPETQFSRGWDDVLSRCRGLVVDNDGFQYSNPIPKFFNIEELEPMGIELPTLPYEITDKIDGSCIEVFYYGGHMVVSTLGSFTSSQAIYAESLLRSKYSHLTMRKFNVHKTYIFELVIPQNRIVLDYGSDEKLVLIAIRDNDTDEDTLEDIGFPMVDKFDKSIEEILLEKKREDFINKEGFVVKFSNGFRVKVKYEEYFRLHKIMTGVNERFVWEFLKDGKPLPLENVPDEFFQYVDGVRTQLLTQYTTIDALCSVFFEEIPKNLTRKEFALTVLNDKHYKGYAAILFKMLENKPYDQLIWKMIEPKMTETQKFNSFRGVNTNEISN